MRLIQISAAHGWRGHEQQIIYYYEEFQKRVEYQILICPTQSGLSKVAKERDFNFVQWPYASNKKLRWARELAKIIKRERIDIILIHSSKAQTICVLSSVLYNLKVPMVFFRTLIRKVDNNFLKKWKYNYKYLRKIVCVSQAVVDEMKSGIYDHNRLSIVGSATDLGEFCKKHKTFQLHDELGLSHDTRLIANISAFVPFKDHHTFVRTVEILKPQINNTKFLLIGKGPLEEEIKKYADNRGVMEDIIFLGFRDDIPNIFSEFDIFLFTSKLEPTGGVLLEAYASHVAVVASNGGGIPEVVVDGKTGLLCEKENPESFAKAVVKLIENPDLKSELIENGYSHLVQNFTKEIIAEKMYQELLEVQCH